MSTPILATKLYIPPPQPRVVLRPRLIERLNEGMHSRLTLICAPAGFGKSTLISEWLARGERPAAWFSLEEGDNDPTRFLAYLIAALQTVEADIGEGVLAMLGSPQPPPTESVLTALLNEIATVPDDFVLVLDDYHVVDSRAVDNALAFLLDHLPPRMHLIIATREDPNLPLARLRARGQSTELRADDLRFTPSEAGEFLNRVMDLDFSEEDIAALETRTEGWIAGLQLAALSMRGHQDAASFIKSFTGSHHFVLDYLVEEVLGQQSESVQAFLLRTAILDYLCGPLCDAVVLDPSVSGQETLEYIEHANLFIVPLDKERRWYRYQHQFAELLRQRLHQSAASVAELHIRASIWYEDNGLGGVGFQVHPRLLTSLTPLRRFYERTRISSKLDVAFLLESPARLASLQSEALAEEPLMVLAPPDHRLVGSCRVEPADMAGEQILLTEPWGNYRLMFERELAEAGAVPSAALELDGVEAVKQCVVAGMGVAMLPAVTVEAELERGELATLRWAGRSLTIPAQTFSL